MKPRLTFAFERFEVEFERAESMPETTQGRKCILVADDDKMVQDALVAVLESEGYETLVANNVRETVSRVTTDTPDLVLLDLKMPGGDGWNAFSQFDRRNPLLPVIVITALPQQYPEAVRLGVDAFMEKPLNIPLLLHTIRRLILESPQQHVRRITDHEFITRFLNGAPHPPRLKPWNSHRSAPETAAPH